MKKRTPASQKKLRFAVAGKLALHRENMQLKQMLLNKDREAEDLRTELAMADCAINNLAASLKA